jgi:hypothetical protein
MPPSSELGAVGSVSAVEAVRDGHRVTVIEALGFEPFGRHLALIVWP